MELHIDPNRSAYFARTGICVRARDVSGSHRTADIAELTLASLVAWLHGGDGRRAGVVLAALLGHSDITAIHAAFERAATAPDSSHGSRRSG